MLMAWHLTPGQFGSLPFRERLFILHTWNEINKKEE